MDTDEFLLPNSKNIPGVVNKMRKHGIVMDILKQARQNGTYLKTEAQKRWWGQNDCITLQRNQFSAFESNREYVIKDVPTFLKYGPFVHPHSGKIPKSRKHVFSMSLEDLAKAVSHLFPCSFTPISLPLNKNGQTQNDILYWSEIEETDSHYSAMFQVRTRKILFFKAT